MGKPGPWVDVGILHDGFIAGRHGPNGIETADEDRVLACMNAMEGAKHPVEFITLICGYMDASLWALQEGETKEAERYLAEGIAALAKLGAE